MNASASVTSLKPWPYLSPGDRVHVVSPASYIDPSIIPSIIAFLEAQGWNPVIDPQMIVSPYDESLPFAQTHAMRASLLYEALNDPTSKAVLFTRGGYGVAQTLHYLQHQPIPQTPKMIVGFSDATALHLYVARHWGWPTLHGEMLRRLVSDERPELIRNEWIAGLSGRQSHITITIDPMNHLAHLMMDEIDASMNERDTSCAAIGHQPLTASLVPTSITGTNLALVTQSIGTFWEADTKGKVLLVEDDGETAESLHRRFTHLSQAGLLDAAKAVIIGSLTRQPSSDIYPLEPMVQDVANLLPCPVFRVVDEGEGFIGHDRVNHLVPLGTDAYFLPGGQCVVLFPGIDGDGLVI